jgi:oligosaccharide repeat unit polymerase
MRTHPAIAMLAVWLSAFLVFVFFPFQFTFRTIHVEGLVILGLFLSVFVIGSLFGAVKLHQRQIVGVGLLDFRVTDLFLKTASIVTCASFCIVIIGVDAYTLASAFAQREERAQGLIVGSLEGSSVFFKVGFFFYPAAYVYLVRALAFDERPRWMSIVLYAVLPPVLAALALGGRNPILGVIAYGIVGFSVRRMLWGTQRMSTSVSRSIPRRVSLIAAVMVFAALIYFVNVFFVRAESVGGVEIMLDYAASRWGVTFAGPGADMLTLFFGSVGTYLVFVALWYFYQGAVISNEIFANYDAAPMLGIYGSDLLTGLMRRVSPEQVSSGFEHMLQMGTYGFLPSAFGTLYVDFLYGGLFFAFVWGWFAGSVYRKTRLGRDPRWFLVSPFVTVGVFFSLMNTPFGFNNGYLTHIWLALAFLLIGKSRLQSHFGIKVNRGESAPTYSLVR